MTDKYAELRAALEVGPTPGPWRSHEHGVGEFLVYRYNPILDQVAVVFINQDIRYETGSMDQQGLDVAYIAACHPEAIRSLLAERDALRDALEAIVSHHDDYFKDSTTESNMPWIGQARAALTQGEV